MPQMSLLANDFTALKQKALQYLAEYFGFDRFRLGQESIVDLVLQRKNILAIMPTGAGKSLCYQLPSLVMDGVTLVVSPLISLMKDQTDELQRLLVEAAFINSSISQREQQKRIALARQGKYRLLYIAPERFRNKAFLGLVKNLKVNFVAIDEAHCISMWGHDFRPDYLKLRGFIKWLGNPPVIALTATATEIVRKDIVLQLGFGDVETVITGFNRPNLRFGVHHISSRNKKNEFLLYLLKREKGCGIIYCATRKNTESVCEYLRYHGIKAEYYHAGMDDSSRDKVQDIFMNGHAQVIVATNAFGMGIDKEDIRFVAHYNIPGSVESYYQESGRAGRDGEISHCILLYSQADIRIIQFLIDQSYPSCEQVEAVYEALFSFQVNPGRKGPIGAFSTGVNSILKTYREIKREADVDIGEIGVGSSLRILQEAGILRLMLRDEHTAAVKLLLAPKEGLGRLRKGLPQDIFRGLAEIYDLNEEDQTEFRLSDLASYCRVSVPRVRQALFSLHKGRYLIYQPPFRGRGVRLVQKKIPFTEIKIDWDRLRQRKAYEQEKLQQMIDYAQSRSCRRAFILSYFGEGFKEQNCSGCDICCPRLDYTREPDLGPEEYYAQARECILECISELPYPVGKVKLAQIVTGSRAGYILNNGMDRLNSYGRLHIRLEEVIKIIHRLIKEGYIQQVPGEYPVLKLDNKWNF